MTKLPIGTYLFALFSRTSLLAQDMQSPSSIRAGAGIQLSLIVSPSAIQIHESKQLQISQQSRFYGMEMCWKYKLPLETARSNLWMGRFS